MMTEGVETSLASIQVSEDWILVDTGSTGDLFTTAVLEKHAPSEQILKINPQSRRRYRYANNQTEVCESTATVLTKLGKLDIDVRLGDLHRPSLLGMRTLKKFRIDLQKLRIEPVSGEGQSMQLHQLHSGHIAVKAEDLFNLS